MAGAIGQAFVDVKFNEAQVKAALGDLGKQASASGSSVTGVGDSIDKSMGKATKSTRGLSTGLGGVAKSGKALLATAGVGFGLAAGVNLIKGAIGAASSLNEQVSKAGVVFKSSGADVVAWSKGLATSFGVSQRAALEAAGTFGNMLVPMKIAPKAAAAMSKKLVELGADMASFNNASPDEVLDALRAGLAGETEPLRRFGVFISAARVQAEALSSGLVKTTKDTTGIKKAQLDAALAQQAYTKAVKAHGDKSVEAQKAAVAQEVAEGKLAKQLKGRVPDLTAAQKAQATYNIIQHDTIDAQGDLARTSESEANQRRIAAAQWENLSAKLGGVFLPVQVAVLKVINHTISALGDIKGVLSAYGDIIAPIAAAIGVLTAAYLVNIAVTKAFAIAQGILNAVMAVNPFVLVVVALAALGAALVVAYQRSATFRKIVQAAFEGVKVAATVLSNAFKAAFNAVRGSLDTLQAGFERAFKIIQVVMAPQIAAVKAFVVVVTGVVKIVAALLRGDWAGAWNAAKGIVTGVVAAVRGALTGVVELIKQAIPLAGKAALAVGKAIVLGILKLELLQAQLYLKLVTFVGGAIVDALQFVYNAALGLGGKIASGIKQGFLNAIKGLGSTIGGALGSILPHISVPGFSPVDQAGAKAIGKPLAEGVIAGFVLGSATMGDKIAASVKAAVDRGRTAIDNARGSFSSAWDRLAGDAMKAFDARTTAALNAIDAKLQARLSRLDQSLAARVARWDRLQQALTPAEKQLAALDRQAQDTQVARGIEDATAALQKAQGGQDGVVDPEQVKQAQQQLADALLQQRRLNLERQAAVERQARDQEFQAKIAAATKETEALKAQATADAARQTLEVQAQRDLRNRALGDALVTLQANLARRGATEAESQKAILALLRKYGIRYDEVAQDLGNAFVRGLKASLAGAVDEANRVARQIELALARATKAAHAAGGGGGPSGAGPAGVPVQAALPQGAAGAGPLGAAPAAPLGAGAGGGSGLAGPASPTRGLSRTLAAITGAMVPQGGRDIADALAGADFRFFIGDTELKDLVRVEVTSHDAGVARVLLAAGGR